MNKTNEEELKAVLILRALATPTEVTHFKIKNIEKLVDGNVIRTSEFKIGFVRRGNKRQN